MREIEFVKVIRLLKAKNPVSIDTGFFMGDKG